MSYERLCKLPDGNTRRQVEVQTELTELQQVGPNAWARQLRRW